MADSTQRRGRDTFVYSVHPDTPYAKVGSLRLTNGSAKVYVYLPLPGIRRRTIESATLSVPVKDAWAAQTLTATPVDEDWGPRKTVWSDQPALRTGQAVSQAQTAKADGERVEIDVTAYVQTIADGAKHWGWCITTSSTANNRLYGFESTGHGSWLLTVDFIEAPEPPTDLSPNGGVVSVMPVLNSDFTDLGGESTELAALNDQVNSTASSSGAWDSGEVAVTLPADDLAASSCPVPTSGSTRYWRRRVKDGAGYWSAWSDWASFIYAPKPTLVIDNPATGLAWDPTPTIAAHLSSGVIKAWRIRIAKGNDKSKVLYDSGKKPGNGTSSLAHTLPFRNDEGHRILKDDDTYWLNIRVWDRNDREATPGDPTWIQEWTQFVMDDDATPPAPEFCMAVQIGDTPRIRVTWQRSTGYPEGWVIRRDGEVIARLDPDEVTTADNGYSWVDSTATPMVDHTYTVKCIDGGKQTVQSPEAHVTPEVEGLWLLSDDDEVKLDGADVTGFTTTDKRATYTLINRAYDVDIVHALGGVVGSYAGAISTRGGRDWAKARATLIDMRGKPHQEVQLVYGTVSVPVKLRNVSVLPSPVILSDNMRHDVKFDAQQTSDFEVGV